MTTDGDVEQMLDQDSTLARRHSESEWWIRLASFANQTEVERSIRVNQTAKTLSPKTEPRQKGSRLSVWGPFLLAAGRLSAALFQRDHMAKLQRF